MCGIRGILGEALALDGKTMKNALDWECNQPTLENDIALFFKNRRSPDQGRIEMRRIWCSTELNAYIDFLHVGQVFLIERE